MKELTLLSKEQELLEKEQTLLVLKEEVSREAAFYTIQCARHSQSLHLYLVSVQLGRTVPDCM